MDYVYTEGLACVFETIYKNHDSHGAGFRSQASQILQPGADTRLKRNVCFPFQAECLVWEANK